MKLITIIAVTTAAMLTVASPASARHYHHHYKIHGTFSFTYQKHTKNHAHIKKHVDDASSLVATTCDNDGRCHQEYAVQSEKHARHLTKTNNDARLVERLDPNGSPTTNHKATTSRGVCPGCVVVSTAANIDITVHASVAAKYQSLIGDFVAQGYHPKDITCFAYGHKSGSNHAIGMACDFDQKRWGVTAPTMYHATSAINREGLFDGGAFGDWGHVEAIRGLHNHPPNLYASLAKYQATRNYQP